MRTSIRTLGFLAAVLLSSAMPLATSSAQSTPGEVAPADRQASQAMMQGMMKTMQGMMAMMQKQMMAGTQAGEEGRQIRRGSMRANCDLESGDSSNPAMMQMMQGMMQMMETMHKQVQSTDHSHEH